jgi:hypothetical protein
MKTGHSRDPNTIASYHPFSLQKKRKTSANFLDANLIWVATKRRDTSGLACLYRGGFDQKMHTFRSVKGVCEEKDARDGSSLADLYATRRVAPCRWLVGITLPKNKGHALFSKSWA